MYEEDEIECYLPYPTGIHVSMNKRCTVNEKGIGMLGALVLIPVRKSIKVIPENYKLLYKILTLYCYYEYNIKKEIFNSEEELKKALKTLLESFTIHIIGIKRYNTSEGDYFLADMKYIKEFSRDKLNNSLTFTVLNKIFYKLGIKVPIYCLDFDLKTVKNVDNKNLADQLNKEFNDLGTILSDYNRKKQVYTILGEDEDNLKYSVFNENDTITEETLTKNNVIDLSKYNDLSFILDLFIINNDEGLTQKFINNLDELYREVIAYKENYGDLFRKAIDDMDFGKLAEIKKEFIGKKQTINEFITRLFNCYI